MQWIPILLLLIVACIIIYVFLIAPSASASTSSSPAPSEQQVVLNTDESASQMLQGYYVPAQEKVSLDYPPTKIGCCPFSKPMSTDLPIGNIPMCYASQSKTNLKEI